MGGLAGETAAAERAVAIRTAPIGEQVTRGMKVNEQPGMPAWSLAAHADRGEAVWARYLQDRVARPDTGAIRVGAMRLTLGDLHG